MTKLDLEYVAFKQQEWDAQKRESECPEWTAFKTHGISWVYSGYELPVDLVPDLREEE